METTTLLAIEITALAVIVVMCLLIYSMMQNTLVMRQLAEHLKPTEASAEEQELFNGEQAEKWFEKGDLKSLNHYCEHYIAERPNSVHANWYFALSHYTKGDYEVAREYFENVIRINPLWRDGAIVYLQEIADKIGMPNNNTVH